MSSEQLKEWVIPNAGAEFKTNDFWMWNKPSVYLLLAENGTPLYIGMSRNGLLRIAQRKYRHAKRELAFKECATI